MSCNPILDASQVRISKKADMESYAALIRLGKAEGTIGTISCMEVYGQSIVYPRLGLPVSETEPHSLMMHVCGITRKDGG